ncbi:MAG: transketolase [Candidatus Rokubacteria bacterium]|nr:transketolase [Candidatus Rokubacteria bacterium]
MTDGADDRIAALEDVATRLRINSIRATTAAGSGHPTSCASAADLVAAIFFDAMRFDPDHPREPASDRFVLSKGHAAPVLYAAWTEVGTVKLDELLKLRELGNDLEGHPTPRLPFVDVATGSLGQGLSAGVGLAIGARLAGTDARVYVLMGDGGMAEGSVWEAAGMASHEKLGSLVGIVDVNALGQSGPTMLGHDVKAYQRRFAAFGWRTVVIDGHDMRAVVDALARARLRRDAPTAIVARTVKGQGIDEVAGLQGWHGKALPRDMAERAIATLEGRLHHVPAPAVTRPRRRRAKPLASNGHAAPPPLDAKPGSSAATRETYGDALVRLGAANDKVVAIDGDVKNSTFAEKFLKAYPARYVEGFIAEQNMIGVAGGLAAQGFVPFASSFACFLERAADQIRMLGISRSNVKLCGSHAGVSIGEDGPSQMALEDLALLRTVPEAVVFYPSEAVSTEACVRLGAEHHGMVYIRTTRPKTPVLYADDERFAIGGLKVVRASDADRCTIVAAGITLHEALAAHDELAKDGIATRVIDLYCVKPVDAAGLKAAARATGYRVVTVEDHYAQGGIRDAVLEALGDAGVILHSLAVREIPRSGPPQKLLEKYAIDRGAIARKVREILG